MPELPEVETVRMGLAPAVDGAMIEKTRINRPNLRFPFPEGFEARLTGRCVVSLSRRAKYLLWHLEDGTLMIVHLGMSGSFRVEAIKHDDHGEHGDVELIGEAQFTHERSKQTKHDHVELWMRQQDGTRYKVTYNDPRRFGFMLFQEPDAGQHPMLTRLGIEPTGNRLDGAILAELFKTKKAPLKAALLDQSLVAGLGNIYVCEALWRSGLSPKRAAHSVATPTGRPTQKSQQLADAIRDVIQEAIKAGGSSLRDHRQTDGEMGYFQHNFAVYDQEGSDCRKDDCNGAINRIVQSGRSTFYCPKCQK